jgi:hypothetical protein
MIFRRLTRTELVWARDAFDAIFPGHSSSRGVGTMDIEGYLENLLRTVPLEPAIGIRLAIWIVAFAPLFVVGRFATIHGLSKGDREKVIGKLVTNPIYAIRQLVIALKAVAALLYAGDREVRTAMLAPKPQAPIALGRKPEKTPSVPPPGSKGGHRVAVA